MRNTLKQAIVLWGMVLLLVLWSVFISPSGVLRWAGAAAIVLAVAALLIYRRRQAWTEMTGDAGLSSLPPETYRQPVVLVCGGLSAHLSTDSPVRQVSEGLYLHVPDEEQLVAQVERLLTLRPAWASQLAVAYTIMPGIHRDVAVLAGRLRRWARRVPGYSYGARHELKNLVERLLTATFIHCELLPRDPAAMRGRRLSSPNLLRLNLFAWASSERQPIARV